MTEKIHYKGYTIHTKEDALNYHIPYFAYCIYRAEPLTSMTSLYTYSKRETAIGAAKLKIDQEFTHYEE